MAEVLVWGGGGHGRVVADIARVLGHRVVGYADGNAALMGKCVDAAGGSVLFDEGAMADWLQSGPDRFLALGVGSNRVRLARSRSLDDRWIPPLAHSRSCIAAGVRIGDGSVVLACAVVNACAVLGRAVIVNSAAVVEHDVVVGDGSHVGPGAVLAGASVVGEEVLVGANSTVIPGISVGAGAVIGAGSVVIRDVPAGATVAGNPARRIR